VATPDGEDRYKLVMVLRNPGEETVTSPLRLVPPDADRRSFDRYMEDVIETERTLAPGETAVVERPITRPTAESPPFGEFNWRVNGVPVPVVVSYGDLRDETEPGSGSDGSGS